MVGLPPIHNKEKSRARRIKENISEILPQGIVVVGWTNEQQNRCRGQCLIPKDPQLLHTQGQAPCLHSQGFPRACGKRRLLLPAWATGKWLWNQAPSEPQTLALELFPMDKILMVPSVFAKGWKDICMWTKAGRWYAKIKIFAMFAGRIMKLLV